MGKALSNTKLNFYAVFPEWQLSSKHEETALKDEHLAAWYNDILRPSIVDTLNEGYAPASSAQEFPAAYSSVRNKSKAKKLIFRSTENPDAFVFPPGPVPVMAMADDLGMDELF